MHPSIKREDKIEISQNQTFIYTDKLTLKDCETLRDALKKRLADPMMSDEDSEKTSLALTE